MMRKLEYSIQKIGQIRDYCKSEINGTFYDDYEKRWENDPEIKPKYNQDTVYEYILGIWENHPNPELDIDIKAFVDQDASFSTGLSETLFKFFPEAGPYKQNEEGEMEKVSMLDEQIDNNLRAGAILAAIEEYNERLARIKDIADKHGNLGEILNLIGNE